MDAHGERLLAQYRERLPRLEELRSRVEGLIGHALQQQGVDVSSLESRIKTEHSLAGKLERKGSKYSDIGDITDLLGVRVITFYTDDVDKVAAMVAQQFEVDWVNSVDKRKLHELDSFGYNSLHYICRLPHGTAPDELCAIPFEVQMRTVLQHLWATINHDTGYKSDVQLPRYYLRQFSRIAGMLELIDDEFSRLRTSMADYRRQMLSLVASGRLDEVELTTDSWQSYLETKPFERLNRRIAAVNQAEIFPASLEPYLPVLKQLGMKTLGDVQRLLEQESDDAYLMAVTELGVTDLDILSESVGLHNLCLVHALKNGGGTATVALILNTLGGNSGNASLAEAIVHRAATLPFMQQ